MLIIAIIIIEGPYKASINPNIIMLSITPKSFENLFINNPEGVLSKKLPGERTIVKTMFS